MRAMPSTAVKAHNRSAMAQYLYGHSHVTKQELERELNSPGKSGKGRDLECCREDAGEDSCLDRFFHSDPPHLNLALISL